MKKIIKFIPGKPLLSGLGLVLALSIATPQAEGASGALSSISQPQSFLTQTSVSATNAYQGDRVTLQGGDVQGDGPLSYQWFYDQTNAIAGATGSSLFLSNVQLTAAGNYSVVVSNVYGSVNSEDARLTVNPTVVVVSAPAWRDPWTAPAAPASDCISTSRTVSPKMFLWPLAAHSSVYSAMLDEGVMG